MPNTARNTSVPRRLHRLAALGIAVAAIGVGGVVPAQAAEGTQWWYDLYGVAEAQAEGWTGEGVRIAVIDDQINPDLPVFADADLTVADDALCAGTSPVSAEWNTGAAHGSTSTAILVGNGQGAAAIRGLAPDAAVTFYGFGNGTGDTTTDGCEVPPEAQSSELTGVGWGITRAIDDGAQIISMSYASSQTTWGDEDVIAEAIARGVVIVASITNEAEATLQEYPWSYNGVVSVNAVDADGNLQLDPASGSPRIVPEVTVVAAGSRISTIGGADGGWDAVTSATGSSLSTPMVAGMLALTAQKYPDATGNQLIQALIHNTWADDHPLERDTSGGFGYGAASLRHLLREDPAQFPDENPLMDKSLGAPTADQVAALSTATPEPSASSTASSDDPGAAAEEGLPGWLTAVLVGGGVLAVLVVAGIVLTIVLINRSKKHTDGGAS